MFALILLRRIITGVLESRRRVLSFRWLVWFKWLVVLLPRLVSILRLHLISHIRWWSHYILTVYWLIVKALLLISKLFIVHLASHWWTVLAWIVQYTSFVCHKDATVYSTTTPHVENWLPVNRLESIFRSTLRWLLTPYLTTAACEGMKPLKSIIILLTLMNVRKWRLLLLVSECRLVVVGINALVLPICVWLFTLF